MSHLALQTGFDSSQAGKEVPKLNVKAPAELDQYIKSSTRWPVKNVQLYRKSGGQWRWKNPAISDGKWPPRSPCVPAPLPFVHPAEAKSTAIGGWLRRRMWLSLSPTRRIQRDRGANTGAKRLHRTVNLHYRATGKQHGACGRCICVLCAQRSVSARRLPVVPTATLKYAPAVVHSSASGFTAEDFALVAPPRRWDVSYAARKRILCILAMRSRMLINMLSP